MEELNLQSIGELPQIEGLADGDYLLAVSGGKGRLLPAGNFSGGSADVDCVIEISGDSFSGVLAEGTFDAIKARFDEGRCPNAVIRIMMDGMPLYCATIHAALMPDETAPVVMLMAGVMDSMVSGGSGNVLCLPIMIASDGTVTIAD